MRINLKTLIGKVNDTSRAATTRAAAISAGLGQFEVYLEQRFLARAGRCTIAVATWGEFK